MLHGHRRTKNYSGADLEGLVKTSVSYAFERVLRGGGRQEEVTVTWEDLEVSERLHLSLHYRL